MDRVISVGRRQRKRQAIHQRLLDEAEGLFQQRGVARTTVDDIAEAADVARQTFFNHFPYKEAVAVELAAEGIQDVAERAQALLEAGTPALDVLRCTAQWILEISMSQGEIAAVVARELQHTDPERSLRAERQIPLRDIFEAILLQAREEGTIREDLPLDIVSSRMSAVLKGVIADVLIRDCQLLRRELSICFDMLFNGIIDRSR